MKRRNRLSGNAAFLVISTLVALLLFSFNDVSAISRSTADIAKPEGSLLQFKAGNHILGFSPDKAYLASMDHVLSVQFINAKGVLPKADTNAPALSTTANETLPLGKVVYKNLWEGISLTYVAAKDGITESTYDVAPGADVSRISLHYNVPCEIQKDGSLAFRFDTGTLTESAPIAWQDINGRRQAVEVAFTIEEGMVGFRVGAYDRTRPLIIDPTYEWHTFYGSSGYNAAQGIATDGSGNVYVTGYCANSWDGPTGQSPLNAFHAGGSVNIFVLKLNSSGAYQWHTFYGTGHGEVAYGLAVNGSGDVYVTGESPSAWNGPAPANTIPLNAWSSSPGCSNLFVLKLNSSGAYQWHTFYGPPGNGDNCNGNTYPKGITLDGSGNVYVTGDVWGAYWIGPNGQPPVNPYNDNYTYNPFVLKLNSSGTYQWHTFYGYHNNGGDTTNAIAIDGSGYIYVTGTSSTDWKGPGTCSIPGTSPCPLNDFSGTTDIFVLKLNGSGAYQWHTFFASGEWNGNGAYGMALDGNGSVYVTGLSLTNWNGPGTCSTPGTSPCPLNDFSGSSDIFVLKIDANGAYQWHTFYGSGGNADVLARGIAIHSSGYVYVTGMSWQTWNGPDNTPPVNAAGDFVILKLDTNGAYQWHTFYGSEGNDYVYGIALDGGGNAYVTGFSENSWNGPANTAPLNAYGSEGNHYDLFVLKLNDSSLPYIINLSAGWNFISTPKEPSVTAIAAALGGISSTLNVVWAWNNSTQTWLRYRPQAVAGNTLTTFESGKGYWLHLSSDTQLSIAGSIGSTTIPLQEGWNLIGYNGQDNASAVTSLQPVNGKWRYVWGWSDGAWYTHDSVLPDPALPPGISGLTNFNKGRAYWIKVKPGAGLVEWVQ